MNILRQNHVKYGLLLTALIVVCLLYMYFTGDYSKMQNFSVEGTVLTFLAPLVVYFLGIKAKKSHNGGKLTFKQGVKESFMIALVAGLTSPFVFLAFYLFFNPSLIEYARTVYGMTGASDQLVVGVDMLVQLVGSIVFGTLIGAIISFFLKSKS